MPSQHRHIAQYNRNRIIRQSLAAPGGNQLVVQAARQWEAVVVLYMALQWIDARLAARGVHPQDHRDRNARIVATWGANVNERRSYKDLYVLSRRARYSAYIPTTADLADAELDLQAVVTLL